MRRTPEGFWEKRAVNALAALCSALVPAVIYMYGGSLLGSCSSLSDPSNSAAVAACTKHEKAMWMIAHC